MSCAGIAAPRTNFYRVRLKGCKLVEAAGLQDGKSAVRIANRLYCSPAMKSLLEGADEQELKLLEASIEVIEMDDSEYFKFSVMQKKLASLVKEGEKL